jgi:cobalt-zinc-cadmium efflux system membrane fusion protein
MEHPCSQASAILVTLGKIGIYGANPPGKPPDAGDEDALMRRAFRPALAIVMAGVLTASGMAWMRPGWLPAWARLDVERFASWARLGAHPSRTANEDDGDDERPKRTDTDTDTDADGAEPTIRLASPRLVRRLGFETAAVARERHAHHLACNAESAFNGQHMAEVVSRVSGVVRDVKVDLGQVVRQGDVLAVVEAAQIGSAKVQYHTAREAAGLAQATYDRTVRLTHEKAAPAKTELESRTALNQARANLMDAEQKLRNLSFPDAALERIAATNDTSNRLEIAAPIGGSITLWDATPGEAVEPTTQLFTIVDVATMWLWMDVYEEDLGSVAVGQPVVFAISGGQAPGFSGRVTSVGMEVNPITRTTRVRAELANPGGRLRANQFGQARIRVEPEHEALVVPVTAVQDDGTSERVFLPLDDGVSFRCRTVVTRPLGRAEVLEVVRGLEPGQQVVTTGAFLLLSELRKDAIAEDVD